MTTEQKARTIHPDENRLAAFAERALQGAEHRAVVAHLADCARCREIVFLAREAVAGSESVQGKVAHAGSVARRWQVPVATAAGVAVIGAALLIWHGRRLSFPNSNREVAATVTPQYKTSNSDMPATKTPPATEPGSIPHEANHESQARNRQRRAVSQQPPAPELAFHRLSAPPSSSGPGASATSAAEGLPETRAASPQQSVPLVSQLPATAQPAPPPAVRPDTERVTATAEAKMNAETLGSDAAVAGGLVRPQNSFPQFAIINGELKRWNASEFQKLRLPKGAKAKAVANSADIVLVLSRSRKVYRSTDLGEHWTEVHAQWQGKAATLEAESVIPSQPFPGMQAFSGTGAGSAAAVAEQAARPALTPNTGTNNSAAGPAAKPPSLAARLASARVTFVLTNSAGKRWISDDGGQTWLPE